MHEPSRRYAGTPTERIPIRPSVQAVPDPLPDAPSSIPVQEAPVTPAPEPPAVKSKKQPPADAVLPTMGWPKFRYWLNCRFGQAHKVPVVNDKERRQREQEAFAVAIRQQFQDLEDRKAYLIDYLRWLAAQPGLQPVINVGNIKGSASKTTVSLYLASVIAEFTRKNVLVLPTTNNTATSTVAMMAGIPQGDTITVGELSREIERYDSFRAVSNRVPRTRFGMGVVSEIPDDNVNVRNDYGAPQFVKMVKTILPNVDVLILDNGNDNVEMGSIPLEAVRMCNVLVLTATANLAPTLNKVSSTMAAYRSDTVRPEDAPESFIATPNKVQHAVVVVSNVPDTIEVDFDEITRPTNQSATAPPTLPFRGPTLSVPHDSYMASDDGSVSICDIYAIAPATLVVFLELAVACYEQTAKLIGQDLSSYQSRQTEVKSSKPILRPKPLAWDDTP